MPLMSPLHEELDDEDPSPFSFDSSPRVSLFQEVYASTELLFQSKLTWLLILGPVALIGDATGILGEPICFAFSGLALIPCAERLSYVTEQVAAHTNGTIGALLNATFGNAPELLISTAALRSGFYRVVQLAMLGSMLTNLLFVFGVSCLVGGLRWQVQELRITSGNVSVGMLLAATAGCLFPVALVLSGELRNESDDPSVPSSDVLTFCRVNAAIMMTLYLAYLTFQLGTHKEEFDDVEDDSGADLENELHIYTQRHTVKKQGVAKRNLFCAKFFRKDAAVSEYERAPRNSIELSSMRQPPHADSVADDEENSSLSSSGKVIKDDDWGKPNGAVTRRRGSIGRSSSFENGGSEIPQHHLHPGDAISPSTPVLSPPLRRAEKSRMSDAAIAVENGDVDSMEPPTAEGEPQMSFRTGIVWLFIITLCISAMSDILVDTIDGFAFRMHISEVFTSMVIVPFFSNVAEQVSAILFAYRNEMDLCVGVTVGSAIQIALFVLPGCVLIGMFVDRSMTLFFRGYETACLLFGVLVVAAVLQGGTTNWLVGTFLIGIYTMMAAGFWFHELEDLSTDAELAIQNSTGTRML